MVLLILVQAHNTVAPPFIYQPTGIIHEFLWFTDVIPFLSSNISTRRWLRTEESVLKWPVMFLEPLFQISSLAHTVAFSYRTELIRKNHNCFCVVIRFLIAFYGLMVHFIWGSISCLNLSLTSDYKVSRWLTVKLM